MIAPATVITPIGNFPVIMEGHHPLVLLPARTCRTCAIPLASPIGLAWTKVFVLHCYLYCCACCRYSAESPCPKELNERSVHDLPRRK